jgi:hypothetical protein
MAAMGVWEMILLWAASVGGLDNDLASLIDPADYFQSRMIEVKAGRLTELAGRDPADAKAQMAQLLAIRWLGEHPDQAKKAENGRAALQAIAEGHKAQDPQGFARDHARRALARIDGQPSPAPRPLPPGGALKGLDWFPADATVCAALDLRASGELPLPPEYLRSLLALAMPREVRDELYKFGETAGNIRPDRVAVAFEMAANGQGPHRIYIRYTGAANRKWLTAFLRQNFPDETAQQGKGPNAGPVTILSSEKNAPAFALVGDTDLIMAGYGNDRARHREVVEKVLQVRGEGKGSALAGPLAETLKNVPPRASAFLAAELSDEMQKALTGRGIPLPVAPRRLLIDATRTNVLTVRLRATMKDAGGATALAGALVKLKDQAVEKLKSPPPEAGLPAGALEPIQKTLTTVRVKAQGDTVHGSLAVSGDVFQALYGLASQGLKRDEP